MLTTPNVPSEEVRRIHRRALTELRASDGRHIDCASAARHELTLFLRGQLKSKVTTQHKMCKINVSDSVLLAAHLSGDLNVYDERVGWLGNVLLHFHHDIYRRTNTRR